MELRPRPCEGEPAEGGKEGVLQELCPGELRPRPKPTRTRGPRGIGIECDILGGGKINLCERQGSVPCRRGLGGPVFMPPPSPGPVCPRCLQRVHGAGGCRGKGCSAGKGQEMAEAGG